MSTSSRSCRIAILCLLSMLFASHLIGAEPEKAERLAIPAEVAYRPDVTYCKIDAETELKLDLAYPKKGDGPFPVVVCFHGGGWVIGDRKNTTIIVELAKRGFVAASVEYRLAPKHRFPAALHDAKCAVRWLRANAQEYRIDTKRVAALGYSAGGQLAALLGTTNGRAEWEGTGGHAEFSSQVQAVVCYYAVTDLRALWDSADKGELGSFQSMASKAALKSLLGGEPADIGDRYTEASPITHVGVKTAPTLLLHGAADKIVPLSQGQAFEKKLRKAGVEVELLTLEKAGHNFGSGAGSKDGDKADDAMFAFLKKQLQSQATR